MPPTRPLSLPTACPPAASRRLAFCRRTPPRLPRAAIATASFPYYRRASTMSSSPPSPSPSTASPSSLNPPIGESGRRYFIQRVLQQTAIPPRTVYLASADNHPFILKNVSTSEFDYYHDLYRRLRGAPYLRSLEDTVPSRSMFVFKYVTDHLLNVARADLPLQHVKQILKATLRGLAAMHDRDIVHTDVKPNNILIEPNENQGVADVKLADIEDAAYIPPGSDIVGKQVGNWMWRSPEAHAQGPVGKPSDLFSFGIVCIYALLKRVIFAVDATEVAPDEEPLAIVLERQISYFADEDSLNGLLRHLGSDNPWCDVFRVLRDGFNKSNPRRPFVLWRITGNGLDDEFKDLISGLTNFDPAKRLTASEALAHPWFRSADFDR